MKVLVTGGRGFFDASKMARYLTQVAPRVVIHGGASGADTLADSWARRQAPEIEVRRFPAHWDDLSHPDAVIKRLPGGKPYDARAGHRRNEEMLREGKPDLVLAFPGGSGTRDMIALARRAGLKVIVVK